MSNHRPADTAMSAVRNNKLLRLRTISKCHNAQHLYFLHTRRSSLPSMLALLHCSISRNPTCAASPPV
eukprot:6278934-Pyramimonas_sp.AAC.1